MRQETDSYVPGQYKLPNSSGGVGHAKITSSHKGSAKGRLEERDVDSDGSRSKF